MAGKPEKSLLTNMRIGLVNHQSCLSRCHHFGPGVSWLEKCHCLVYTHHVCRLDSLLTWLDSHWDVWHVEFLSEVRQRHRNTLKSLDTQTLVKCSSSSSSSTHPHLILSALKLSVVLCHFLLHTPAEYKYISLQIFIHLMLICACMKLTRTITLRDAERKARQQQQHNRKAKQRNTTHPKQSFSKKNWLPRVGFEPTTIISPGDGLTN